MLITQIGQILVCHGVVTRLCWALHDGLDLILAGAARRVVAFEYRLAIFCTPGAWQCVADSLQCNVCWLDYASVACCFACHMTSCDLAVLTHASALLCDVSS